jgi:integrase
VSASVESRTRIARRQAKSLGIRLIQRGSEIELRDADGRVLCGALSAVETYLREHYRARPPGPAQARVPAAWAAIIADYCLHLAAAGMAASTIASRRKALGRIGRDLKCPPADITAELLVEWFGRQHWKPETRRFYHSTARGFFAWAYKYRRVTEYLPDHLPSVPIPPATARPVTDDAWRRAIAGADPRVALMMRLAAEAGLRRAEVAQAHTRDVLEGSGGAQLVVHGKGGRTRVVPISDSLAAVLRLGANGHTPGMPTPGWLFPTGLGGHLTPQHVGVLVARALPDGWSMHKLRHRFATRAYRGSRNLRAVQVLLGHASIATTERYTAVDDEEIRAAMMSALSD